MGDGASSSAGGGARREAVTVVSDHGRRRTSCGYCRSPGHTSISHGLWAHSLTVDDYQELLDRGWRRSGSFLYKPEMDKTCCPSYTIRLNVADFVPSKEQARVNRKMQSFLDGKLDVKETNRFKDNRNEKNPLKSSHSLNDSASLATKGETSRQKSTSSTCEFKEDEYVYFLSNKINDAVEECFRKHEHAFSVQLPKAAVKKVIPQAKRKLSTEMSEGLLYTSNISFQIAAVLRRLQREEGNSVQVGLQMNNASQNGELLDFSPDTVAQKLAYALDQQGESFGLSIRACSGHLNFYLTNDGSWPTAAVVVSVDSGVQTSKGSGSTSKRSSAGNTSSVMPHKRRKLEIHMKRSSFDIEEFNLYRKYQIKVHNDKPEKVTESSYRRFLVDSPLVFLPSHNSSRTVPPCGFGSFHQQYRIDGRLVAVGVVDVLPKCLSSKYLFWDPDLAFLSLGKYSALQEINWVKEANVHCSSLQYYYLGYYIHSCSKMRYKAAYCPSELLCPQRYEWVSFDMAKPLLDRKSYVVLSDIAALPNARSSSMVSDNLIQQSPEYNSQNEDSSEEDEEMELDFEALDASADDDSGQETSTESVTDLQPTDISNIVIDLNGSRVKFKDLQQVFGPIQKRHMDLLEMQLHRYAQAVGKELSSSMIYTLG